jgi:Guanine nucleotide exchange factor in Golgi transport N-terminal/Dimerisation and cyclophilin-binding domain of Mon2
MCYAQALLLCFKLHESRTVVVSSTAAATLRQLVMFVVDKVVEEDRRLLLANELESITLPDGNTQTLGPAARDAFAIFEDLCLLGNGEHPQLLQLDHLHKTFALELIESVLTNYHDLFRKARAFSLDHPCQSHIFVCVAF